jgi:hypothetical protein
MEIDLNIAAGSPAELLEPLMERTGAQPSFRIVLGVEHQYADPPRGLAMLRARREGPGCSATDEGNEIAPSHRPLRAAERLLHRVLAVPEPSRYSPPCLGSLSRLLVSAVAIGAGVMGAHGGLP